MCLVSELIIPLMPILDAQSEIVLAGARVTGESQSQAESHSVSGRAELMIVSSPRVLTPCHTALANT